MNLKRGQCGLILSAVCVGLGAAVASAAPVEQRALVTQPVQTASGVKAVNAAEKSGVEWIRIPGGTFMMGEGAQRHKVTLKAYEMAKTVVTNKQYKACVAAGSCTVADTCGHPSAGDDRPQICVDFDQAQQFAKWVGGRLPTEAEWEYAARSAGKDRAYPWGDEAASCANAVVSGGCGRKATWPVCSKPSGNTEQGLCDMSGNTWQWVQDWYHPTYEGAPTNGSAFESPAGTKRVFRGGSWSSEANDARSTTRDRGDPALRICDLSFRPMREILADDLK